MNENKNDYQIGMVSIGIPAYNRAESLRKVLNIAISQTYQNIEIIVSDDASPDDMVREVIEEFLPLDARVRYYKQEENKGVLANADFVLKMSQGEYFTWFSDDDWRAPEFVESMVAELQGNKDVNMAFCDYHEVYEDGSRALGYPSTHMGVFKPFQSQKRLMRIFACYWQDGVKGNCNIFYSVFRKKALDTLNIREISGGYQYLNMDRLIVFSMLQMGPVIIYPEVLCTLTCGNKKYYPGSLVSEENKQKTFWSKLIDFYKVQKQDRGLYIKNTSNMTEKIVIFFTFIPKTMLELVALPLKKWNFIIRKSALKTIPD